MSRRMRNPSVMKHSFSQAPSANISRSTFSRSHGHKTTVNSGLIIPILADEVLPGDTFSTRLHAVIRMATPIKPIMDNLYADFFFFYCPNRILWDDWKRFMGEKLALDNSTDIPIPKIVFNPTPVEELSMGDYLGLPLGFIGPCNCFHFRAYNNIYNEWFRAEFLQEKAYFDPTQAGADDGSNYPLRRRGKRHDYFTSALPWPQVEVDVDVPLGNKSAYASAPVVGIGKEDTQFGGTPVPVYESGQTGQVTYNRAISIDPSNPASLFYVEEDPDNSLRPNIRVDLSNASPTVRSLREAFQLQKMFEREARGGQRYTEIIQAHFNVHSPDARQNRPELLGLGRVPVTIAPIAQTTPSDIVADVTPQGNLSAIGYAGTSGKIGFTKSFTEHGVILGLMQITADLNYQNNLNRMWTRDTKWDYYWPALAHISEQPILRQEMFLPSGSSGDKTVWGYQEAWADYRYKPSMITGKFRSDSSTPLDVWHLAQDFAAAPELNDEFIQDNPPVSRVVAVPSEPEFLADLYFAMNVTRPMPTYSIPGLVDHF